MAEGSSVGAACGAVRGKAWMVGLLVTGEAWNDPGAEAADNAAAGRIRWLRMECRDGRAA